MTVKNAAGVAKSKTQAMAQMTDVTPDENKVYRFASDSGTTEWYRHETLPGKTTIDGDKQLAFVHNGLYSKAEIDALYPAATISSFSPSTGLAAAGGTTVTAVGDNLTGVTAVTVGGTSATSVTVVNRNTITFVTPAKTAGTYDVIATDDSGTVTKTAALTFV